MRNNSRTEELRAIASETVAISNRSNYIVGENVYQLPPTNRIEYSKHQQVANVERNASIYYDNIKEFRQHSSDTLPNIIVEDIDVVSAWRNSNKINLGILNFASGVRAGGRFLQGQMAQEEALCYCSNLYVSQLGAKYYQDHLCKTNLYSDAMQIADITCIRDNQFNLTSPVTAKVLSASAPNLRRAKRVSEVIDEVQLQYTLFSRIDKILEVFYANGCKNLILGAFGCGAYGNDVHIISKIFFQLLSTTYRDKFDSVVFAIPAKSNVNHKVFYRTFCEL